MGEITTSSISHWTYTHVRDRRLQTLLARLRIGHTYLTQRYLLTRDPQPYCDDCLVPLTVRHLIVECPSLTDLRHRYLYRCRGRYSGVYYLSKILGPQCLAQGHDAVLRVQPSRSGAHRADLSQAQCSGIWEEILDNSEGSMPSPFS
ncbi:hypothetical protein E2C01_066859 [Portunus trituberculatus]|uniref:RNase H type-1 domain-containing protein n=1 Tax=Portunus trituberculatus TaxID=210409 RepID=A0A5B7HTG6_PORTR|nr:hypothetical protein [Portunus trituberculatus]